MTEPTTQAAHSGTCPSDCWNFDGHEYPVKCQDPYTQCKTCDGTGHVFKQLSLNFWRHLICNDCAGTGDNSNTKLTGAMPEGESNDR